MVEAIAELLRETAEAHHRAFLDADGDDPDWPLWYSEYMLDPLEPLLDASLTRSELVYALVQAERDRMKDDSGTDWQEYYGAWLVERYA